MKAMDRLIRGEVPAAVLTLVSAEAAEWFPEIPGLPDISFHSRPIIESAPLSPRRDPGPAVHR